MSFLEGSEAVHGASVIRYELLSICIIARGVSFIWVEPWRIIVGIMLMVPVKQITKPTIEERFIVCFLLCVLRRIKTYKSFCIESF